MGVNYSRSAEGAQRTVQEITGSGGQAIVLKADVSREDQVLAMFDALFDSFGTIDILVSNAGIQKDSVFTDMSLEQWNAVLGTNLTGAFLCAREAVKAFLRRGPVPERSRAAGKIIFISSVHEVIPWAGHANYAAAKGGLMMLMKTIAQELAPQKIRVNSIAPGAIKTRINESVWSDPEGAAAMLKLIPYGRIGEADDIAPGRRVAGLRRGGLHHGNDDLRRWRHAALPGLPDGRMSMAAEQSPRCRITASSPIAIRRHGHDLMTKSRTSSFRKASPTAVPASRQAIVLELCVFLFLIVPSMVLSFFAAGARTRSTSFFWRSPRSSGIWRWSA